MLEDIVRKYALKNCHEYGKADANAIVGKVIAEAPIARKDMQGTMALIRKAVSDVNKLGKGKLEEELKAYVFEARKPEGEKKFRIEDAEEGKVVTRFLPEPNGYLHIGHAKAAFLSFELARQYGGKCLLRFDDTNPEAEKQEYVDAIKRNLGWLGLEFASENYTSDKLPQLYRFAEKMIILNRAYVCTCTKEEVNKNRFEKKECGCRGRKGGEHFHLWEKMTKGEAEQGQAILRFKADMQSENTVMRDPTLFRVLFTEHFRQGKKYSCWPTYDFEVSISDSLDGITHALRSKEYELRDELYYAILNAVNLRKPVVYDFSRLNMKGTLLSKRLIKPLIEKKQVLGWDDPRLPTLDGLKRRGILPAAIREFVLRQGLSKAESEPEFEDLLAINRRLLDPIAPHYFFVRDPSKISVIDLPKEWLIEHQILGKARRSFKITGEFLIPSEDVKLLKKGEALRLKDLFNVKVIGKKKSAIECEYAEKEKTEGSRIVQWVPALESIEAEVMELSPLLDKKGEFNEKGIGVAKGHCESNCNDLKEGDLLQFERYGFCRLDRVEKEKLFFIHSC